MATQNQDRPLFERIYDELLSQIDSGVYPANSRLPGELELAETYAVSRPVVRQALSRLRSEGRVFARRGAGTFVGDRAPEHALSYGPLHSIFDVQRCLEFRKVIECEAAAAAATLHDDRCVREILNAKKDLERGIAAGAPTKELDFAFHLEIAKATQNRFFFVTLEALSSQIDFGIGLIQQLSAATPEDRWARVRREHDAICTAIAEGDPDAARHAMSHHLTAGIERLFSK
ncbi:FadR/GntR family transcriptional regulator [Salipiger sp.]|uniref:FadR/GntR family transcriptional regulator n=1 Tax=Salipiger sp. TaxID=2078585 RepID=UPI003A973EE1